MRVVMVVVLVVAVVAVVAVMVASKPAAAVVHGCFFVVFYANPYNSIAETKVGFCSTYLLLSLHD